MIVLQRVTGYERKEPSKRWPSKPCVEYFLTLSETDYVKNIVAGERWGIERREYSYTYCGYTPVKISSIEPMYKLAKCVHHFKPCKRLDEVETQLKQWGLSFSNLSAEEKVEILQGVNKN